ncbi:sorting nexin lst-4 [Agrilus planipennis]|uniref:Sorting nexin lst-4 n=1 Tax=Agrilus planipennis TaxID=224129 RepID=A0A1W4X5B2_AGRPL|nr:sorting nexin lst-4 [Agrilus planipennis]
MSFQVRALYDFDGEPGTAEMSISSGETLTVTRTDVGEGWWEGVNKNGKSGLFPEAYVEKISANSGGPPQIPAPLLTPTPNLMDDWGSSAQPQPVAANDNDGWDDDWDEDPYSEIQGNAHHQHEQLYSNETNHNLNPRGDADNFSEASFGGIDNKGTVTKKSLNRFSTFVKSGGESYILGTLKVNVDESRIIRIVKLDESTFAWPAITPSNQYTVLVTSPKKETKLKGLKSFIAYQLTPSFNNIQVSRRYKHFDWLHERLCEKFSLVAVPPLPDKQISGRYEEHFIEHRRVQLQEFVNWVCKHPILSKCDVWQHFITCTDEKLWKQGKRAAERDPLQGANFCLCIEAPDKNLLQSWVDERMEININFIHNLDAAVKNLQATATDQCRKYSTAFKKEFCKIGESFYSLGTAIESAEKAKPPDLATGIKRIGTAYFDIGKIYEDQPKLDWEPLADKLYVYRGITGAFPDIFAIHRGAQQKRKECEKINMPPGQLNEVRKRTDTVTYAIFAELNHFKCEREIDLKITMRNYLKEQINFYKKIVEKLEDTLQFFD